MSTPEWPPLSPLNHDMNRRALGGLFGHGQLQVGVSAPRAPDRDDALLLGIEVEELTAGQHVVPEPGRPGQSGLLIHGEQELQGAVLRLVVLHERQHRGHADAVVRSEGRSVRLEIRAVLDRSDGVRLEIVLHIGVLLLHHVQVGLKNRGGRVLVAG